MKWSDLTFTKAKGLLSRTFQKKLPEMTHAIIIRMHYQKGDPRFDWRLTYFKAVVLPRLLNQTRNDFDIAVRCYPWHEEEIKKLSDRIVTFNVAGEEERTKSVNNKKYFEDFTPWSTVTGLNQYDIQSGLDSDDLISEDYVNTIVTTIQNESKGKAMHLCFQPEIFNLEKLRIEPIGYTYTTTHGSAFFSIYQPDKTNYRFAYENSHLKMHEFFKKTIILPSGQCWATVHANNASTRSTLRDIKK